MRYTKNNDGFNGSQQFGYAMQPQQQLFSPQVTVKDNKGHQYSVNMDMSVPYLGLTPKMVKDFKQMEKFVKDTSGANVKELKQFVLLQADVTANSPDNQALLKRFGLFGPPGILFFNLNSEEQKDQRVIGYMPPQRFLDRLLKLP